MDDRRSPAGWKALYESEEFARETTYTGPLGAEYSLRGTRLRLWAPTAQQVSVNLFRKGEGGAPVSTQPMSRQAQGVWELYLSGDQHGRYYTYTVRMGAPSGRPETPMRWRRASTVCAA